MPTRSNSRKKKPSFGRVVPADVALVDAGVTEASKKKYLEMKQDLERIIVVIFGNGPKPHPPWCIGIPYDPRVARKVKGYLTKAVNELNKGVSRVNKLEATANRLKAKKV